VNKRERENAEATRTHDEALGTAFMLLHGNPPKALEWTVGGMRKRSHEAQQYCVQLEKFIAQQFPDIRIKRCMIRRNRVLRILMKLQGRTDPSEQHREANP
jgi:hypothetical protein